MLMKDVDIESVRGFTEESSAGQKSRYCLPKLELVKFDGNPRGWLKFWTQFKGICENESILAEDKFQYLLQVTKKKSKAREIADSFLPMAQNYPKLIAYMKEQFGSDSTLIQVYVRDILKLVRQ
ncbi:uncharacterized protein LOC111641697 [Centruroides sculpturatus]|uniref:uncharacterized protein LOC111641697 n=1 Tax=Centruroides sculpturatus TaxID=218467 RepID=UPI000C6E3DE2|nr:uncharacterized protein LOC111641697 [Centruroides sculpturatus]